MASTQRHKKAKEAASPKLKEKTQRALQDPSNARRSEPPKARAKGPKEKGNTRARTLRSPV